MPPLKAVDAADSAAATGAMSPTDTRGRTQRAQNQHTANAMPGFHNMAMIDQLSLELYGGTAEAGAGPAKENPHHDFLRRPVAASGSRTTKAGSHDASMPRSRVFCRCGPMKFSPVAAPDNTPSMIDQLSSK